MASFQFFVVLNTIFQFCKPDMAMWTINGYVQQTIAPQFYSGNFCAVNQRYGYRFNDMVNQTYEIDLIIKKNLINGLSFYFSKLRTHACTLCTKH